MLIDPTEYSDKITELYYCVFKNSHNSLVCWVLNKGV